MERLATATSLRGWTRVSVYRTPARGVTQVVAACTRCTWEWGDLFDPDRESPIEAGTVRASSVPEHRCR